MGNAMEMEPCFTKLANLDATFAFDLAIHVLCSFLAPMRPTVSAFHSCCSFIQKSIKSN